MLKMENTTQRGDVRRHTTLAENLTICCSSGSVFSFHYELRSEGAFAFPQKDAFFRADCVPIRLRGGVGAGG